MQVHHDAASGDVAPVLRGQDHAPARREDGVIQRTEFRDYLRLACAEARFALNVENHRDAHAAAALDLLVGIVEVALQAPCEQAPHGRLARAHHADQDEAAFGFHGFILRRWKKKRPGRPGRSIALKGQVSERSSARSRFAG